MRPLTFLVAALLSLQCKSWGRFWETNTLSDIEPVYPGHSLWNDYVTNDGPPQAATVVSSVAYGATGKTTHFSASGTACNASATGGYNVCLHAGLLRVATLSGKKDCGGVTASDNLGAFQWLCVPSGDAVKIVSVGFMGMKGLSDLIDFDALAFRPMSLTVIADGNVFNTKSAAWFGNSILDVTGTSTLGTQSAIYLVRSNMNALLNTGATNVAVLIKPTVELSGTGSQNQVLSIFHKFSWVEGAINGLNQGIALNSGGASFSSFRNLLITNVNNATFTSGVNIATADNLRFANTRIANLTNIVNATNGSNGIVLSTVTGSIFSDTRIANKATNGSACYLVSTKNTVFLSSLSANLTEYGCGHSDNSNTGNFLMNITHAHSNTFGGFNFDSAQNTVINAVVSNVANDGFRVGLGGTTTQRNTFMNLSVSQTTANGIYLENTSNNFFTGLIKLGNVGMQFCSVTGGVNPGLANTTCNNSGSSNSSLITGIAHVTSFVGKITNDDAVNISDSNGAVTYSTGLDWHNFENWFRNWGKDGADLTSGVAQGACTTGTCRIWDWSLRATDTVLRAVLPLPTGNDNLVHLWSAASQSACSAIHGAVWQAQVCSIPGYQSSSTCAAAGGTWSTNTCSTRLLRNAYELLEDGIGNENGLCESNEVCIYTPNIGAYQGHGSLNCLRGSHAGCTAPFSDGSLTGITLLQYANNGY